MKLRHWICLVTIALGLCGLIACQPPPPRIPEVLATIPLRPTGGISPDAVVVNPATGWVYVINGASNNVAVITQTHLLATVPVGDLGYRGQGTYSDNTGYVYIANHYLRIKHRGADTVTVMDGARVLTTIALPCGESIGALAAHPHNEYVYVTSEYQVQAESLGPGYVHVVSGTQVIATMPVGEVPAEIAINPRNKYAYVGNYRNSEVSIIDGTTVIATIPLHPEGGVDAIDIDPRTGLVYVLGTAPGYDIVLIEDTAEVARIDDVGYYLRNLQVHPHTGDVYIVDFGADEVVVMRDRAVVARLPVGQAPVKMDIDPLTGNVYVACYESNEVAVIQGTEVLSRIKVGWYPYAIAVNPQNGWVYVANTNDSTVTVLGFAD